MMECSSPLKQRMRFAPIAQEARATLCQHMSSERGRNFLRTQCPLTTSPLQGVRLWEGIHCFYT